MDRKRTTAVGKLLVEPGREYTWVPAKKLEGLNLTVDSARKKLVAAGPLPAARTFINPHHRN